MSVFIGQQPVILRLPEEQAKIFHGDIASGKYELQAEIQPDSEAHGMDRVEDMSPFDPRKNYFRFKCGDQELPALLANLATKLETHKVTEGYKLLKASDIGQMLVVFEGEDERQEMAESLTSNIEQGFHCIPDGITPPMRNVIERKWLKRFNEKGPFKRAAVASICDEVLSGPSTVTDYAKDEVVEVFDEVVPFEEWMVESGSFHNGIFTPHSATLRYDDGQWSDMALQHPHMLNSNYLDDEEWLFLKSAEEAEREAQKKADAKAASAAGASVVDTGAGIPESSSSSSSIKRMGLAEELEEMLGSSSGDDDDDNEEDDNRDNDDNDDTIIIDDNDDGMPRSGVNNDLVMVADNGAAAADDDDGSDDVDLFGDEDEDLFGDDDDDDDDGN